MGSFESGYIPRSPERVTSVQVVYFLQQDHQYWAVIAGKTKGEEYLFVSPSQEVYEEFFAEESTAYQLPALAAAILTTMLHQPQLSTEELLQNLNYHPRNNRFELLNGDVVTLDDIQSAVDIINQTFKKAVISYRSDINGEPGYTCGLEYSIVGPYNNQMLFDNKLGQFSGSTDLGEHDY